MRTTLVVCAGLALGLGIGPCEIRAQAPATEAARLAEQLLERTESHTQRPLDPRFRQAVAGALAALPAEELAERASRGAGIAPLSLGDPSLQTVYTAVAPCRIIDTRPVGGSLAPGAPRDFRVAGSGLQGQGGSSAGCGVPQGPATAAIINFVAVNAVGPGNLRAWAYSEPAAPPPNASVINYASVSGLNIANAVAVPLCDVTQTTCSFDMKVQADGSGTHLVADVVGFFERLPKVVSAVAASSTVTPVGAACVNVPGLSATIVAPAAGTVVVRSHLSVALSHDVAGADAIRTYIGTTAGDCSSSQYSYHALSAGPGTGNYHSMVPLTVAFSVPPGTHTYYANVRSFGGTETVNCCGESSTIEATFFPN